MWATGGDDHDWGAAERPTEVYGIMEHGSAKGSLKGFTRVARVVDLIRAIRTSFTDLFLSRRRRFCLSPFARCPLTQSASTREYSTVGLRVQFRGSLKMDLLQAMPSLAGLDRAIGVCACVC
jgi:hypothetical protein